MTEKNTAANVAVAWAFAAVFLLPVLPDGPSQEIHPRLKLFLGFLGCLLRCLLRLFRFGHSFSPPSRLVRGYNVVEMLASLYALLFELQYHRHSFSANSSKFVHTFFTRAFRGCGRIFWHSSKRHPPVAGCLSCLSGAGAALSGAMEPRKIGQRD